MKKMDYVDIQMILNGAAGGCNMLQNFTFMESYKMIVVHTTEEDIL